MWNLESGHYDLKQASRPSKFLKNDYEAKKILSKAPGHQVMVVAY